VLHKVISTPVLRPDRTLLQTPGYGGATGCYLAGRAVPDPIPQAPTRREVDVQVARRFLVGEFLADFPWRTAADRAWQRYSAGAGTKGPRWYSWAWVQLTPEPETASSVDAVGGADDTGEAVTGVHHVLTRRNDSTGELAFHLC
jgi:hypothetical protein